MNSIFGIAVITIVGISSLWIVPEVMDRFSKGKDMKIKLENKDREIKALKDQLERIHQHATALSQIACTFAEVEEKEEFPIDQAVFSKARREFFELEDAMRVAGASKQGVQKLKESAYAMSLALKAVINSYEKKLEEEMTL